MPEAYAEFHNGGVKIEPTLNRIFDSDGENTLDNVFKILFKILP